MQAITTSMLSCGCLFTKSELCSVRCPPSAEGSVAETPVNPSCGPDSHASVPVWCRNAEVQFCLLCHIAALTPRGNSLASCKTAMVPAGSMRRDSNQQESTHARHNSSETDRRNAEPSVYFVHSFYYRKFYHVSESLTYSDYLNCTTA